MDWICKTWTGLVKRWIGKRWIGKTWIGKRWIGKRWIGKTINETINFILFADPFLSLFILIIHTVIRSNNVNGIHSK